jgi:flagellar FliL protein
MAKAAQIKIEEAEVPAEALPQPKSSRGKLILIVTALLLLLGAGGGAAWYLMDDPDEASGAPGPKGKAAPKSASKAASKDKEPEKSHKPSVFMNLEPFTVNLQSETGDRFLQTVIVFELTDDKVAEAIKLQLPVIRSRLLLLLSAKSPVELHTPQGKEKLADEIVAEASKHFSSKPPEQALLRVHFNSFVIQ